MIGTIRSMASGILSPGSDIVRSDELATISFESFLIVVDTILNTPIQQLHIEFVTRILRIAETDMDDEELTLENRNRVLKRVTMLRTILLIRDICRESDFIVSIARLASEENDEQPVNELKCA